MPFFVGEKVRLRSYTEDDLKDFFRWSNDGNSLGEFSAFRPINWFAFEEQIKEPQPGGDLLVIESLENGKKVGTLHYDRDSERHPYRIWIGYAMHEVSERGKGYATEAVSLLVDFLFKNKNIARIQATVDVSNNASHRVLEKNFFKREGTLRKYYFVDGDFHDHYIYGLTREEWNPRK